MFAYCGNNSISFRDGAGEKIEIPLIGGYEGVLSRIIIFIWLSIITDDKLKMEGSNVIIEEQSDNPVHPAGTELVRKLIADDNTVQIYWSKKALRYGSVTQKTWEGQSPFSHMKKEHDSIIVIDNTQVNCLSVPTPGFIILAHELIHALHLATGEIHPDYEELVTTGLTSSMSMCSR